MISKEAVTDAALSLPDDDRATLAQTLIESLSETERQNIDEAWLAECENRLTAWRNGEIDTVEASDVFAVTDQDACE